MNPAMTHPILMATASAQPTYTVPGSAAAGAGAVVAVWLLLILAIFVVYVVGLWRVFTKAGQPGWSAIIPIYNFWVLLKIVGRPGWWILMMLIPLVSIVFQIIVLNDLSKSFGHGTGFTVGLFFLPFVFVLILAFGSSTYRGPSALGGQMRTGYPGGYPGYPQQSGYPGGLGGGLGSPGAGYGAPGAYGPPVVGSGGQTGGSFGVPPTPGGATAPGAPGGYSPPAPSTGPDWYADPSGRNQHRYWDGSTWTDHVANQGTQSTDPV